MSCSRCGPRAAIYRLNQQKKGSGQGLPGGWWPPTVSGIVSVATGRDPQCRLWPSAKTSLAATCSECTPPTSAISLKTAGTAPFSWSGLILYLLHEALSPNVQLLVFATGLMPQLGVGDTQGRGGGGGFGIDIIPSIYRASISFCLKCPDHWIILQFCR